MQSNQRGFACVTGGSQRENHQKIKAPVKNRSLSVSSPLITRGTKLLSCHFLSATSGHSCRGGGCGGVCVFIPRNCERKQTLTFSISSHLSERSAALLHISTALGLGTGSTVDPPPLGPIRRYTSPARLAEQILPSAAEPALHGPRRRGSGKVAVTRRGGEVTAPV